MSLSANKSTTPSTDSVERQPEQNDGQESTPLSVPALSTSDNNDEPFPFALQADSPNALAGSAGQTASFMCIQTTPTAPEHERKLLVRSTKSFLRTLKTATQESEGSETPTNGKRDFGQLKTAQGNSQHNVLSLLPWPTADASSRAMGSTSSSIMFGDDGKLNPSNQKPSSPRVHFCDHDDWIITSANNNDPIDEAPPLMSRTAAVLDRYTDKQPRIFCSAMKIPKDPRNSSLGYQPLRLNDVKKQLNTNTAGGGAATTTASTGGGKNGSAAAHRNTRAVSMVVTADGGVARGGGATVKHTKSKPNKVLESAADTIAGKMLQRDKPKVLIRPPKMREARFDRDAANNNNNEGFAAPTFPLAHREVEPSCQPSSIGFPDPTKKAVAGKVDRTQFLVRLHVPDLTFTKIFHNTRDGRDKVATSAPKRMAGDTREKRFTDKYPFKLPDDYEDFQDGGDSVVEFAKRRFKQWYQKQMRTSPASREATAPPTAALPAGTKKVHMQL